MDVMLIKRVVLDAIVAGEIDQLFRRWRKPTVKQGGQLRTSVGMLDIVSIEPIARSMLTVQDAHRSGFVSKAALLRELDSRTEGDVYRIGVAFGGADPRITLRENADLSKADVEGLSARLDRLDRSSKRGAWTLTFLELLAANPQVRAPDLAAGLGLETKVFKNDVRKLKELGLTISFSPGYELSPRGHAYLTAVG